MVVWLSDFGNGNGHGSDNLHLAFAGNAGGAQLGRFVNYAEGDSVLSAYGNNPNQPGNHNLAVTLQQAFGIESDEFGDYNTTRQPVQRGPLDLS